MEASRAVTTALWPAAMTASARARPRPVEQPVMNQVDMDQILREWVRVGSVRRSVWSVFASVRRRGRLVRRVGLLVGGCGPAGEEAETVLGAAARLGAVDDQGQPGVGR